MCVWVGWGGGRWGKGTAFCFTAVFQIRRVHLKWKHWLKHPFGRKSLMQKKFRSFSSHGVSKRVRFKFRLWETESVSWIIWEVRMVWHIRKVIVLLCALMRLPLRLTHGDVSWQVFISAWAAWRLSRLSSLFTLARLFEKREHQRYQCRTFKFWGAFGGGFSGVSVGVFGDLCLSLLCWAFFRRLESSSVLKRPSDSNSALFSVTRRDRLVYASGTVRSTAPSNAAYTARVTETAHTHPDSPATQAAHMQSSTDQTQRDVELRLTLPVQRRLCSFGGFNKAVDVPESAPMYPPWTFRACDW